LIKKIKGHGIATAIDLGHPTDIHPKNKREVALRLYLVTARMLYNNAIDYSGPILSNIESNRTREIITTKVYFTHSETGFDFKNSDNCTTCCTTKNNIFVMVSTTNKVYLTVPTLENNHIKLVSTVPINERINSIRQHWNPFQECVVVNKRSRISSPTHFLEVNIP